MATLRPAKTASTTVTCSLRGLLCHSSAVTSRSSCTSTATTRTRLAMNHLKFHRGHNHHRLPCRCFSTTPDDDDASVPTLVQFSKTQLAFPFSVDKENKEDLESSAFITHPFDFSILAPPEIGGSRERRQHQRRRRSSLDYDSKGAAVATPSRLNRRRGYLLLGRNGSGKSLLGHALMDTNLHASRRRHDDDADSCSSDSDHYNAYVRGGTLTVDSKWHSRAVAHVSFDSHQELLRQKDTKVIGVTTTTGKEKEDNNENDRSISAFRAIAGDGVSKLNKAAQFLVVRFGLYALLHRPVSTLSTGEIRKVLLIRALAQRPKLLVLDNAFDGLDVSSREILKDIVRRTLQGFTQDILVHDVAAKDTARTQVVLMTHRVEEMMIPDMESVAFFCQPEDGKNSDEDHYLDDPQRGSTATLHLLEDNRHKMDLNIGEIPSNGRGEATDDWEEAKTNETTKHLHFANKIMEKSLGINDTGTDHGIFDWEDPSLPSVEEVKAWWKRKPNSNTDNIQNHSEPSILVEARDLSIRRGDVTLLHSLNWTIRKGERWVVGGGNGAGKSTLSRILAQPDEGLHADNTGSLKVFAQAKTAWVSTESHLEQVEALKADVAYTHMTTPARSFMEGEAVDTVSWERAILPVLSWLGMDAHTMLSKPFLHLSQGHQKMLLVARALASQPSLLVLDEPCQGLDVLNRRRMLTLVECVCRATDMSLVYITHHFEEVMPSINHALHLKDRYAIFNGLMDSYNPAHYEGHD